MACDNTKIKVSVIVPVYNSEQYLKECLDSIVNQSLQEIEIICVDNDSKDNSAHIIQDYCLKDSRFVYIKNEENRGQAYSRNVGMSKAHGVYFYFVDSDDMLRKDALCRLCKFAEKDELDGILFDAEVIDERESRICDIYKSHREHIYPHVTEGTSLFSSLLNNGEYTAVVWRQFWSAQFLRDNNINFFPQASPHEDLMFTFQAILTAKRIRCISDSYYIYRKHSGATTAKITVARMTARFISYVEILILCRNILNHADLELRYAILIYLNSERSAIVEMANILFQDGYSMEDINFENPIYNMYFQLFMNQANTLLDNYSLQKICNGISAHCPIIIYGAGTIGHRVMRLLKMLGTTNYTVAVTDNSKCTITESGKHIYNIEELKEYCTQSLVLVATAKRYQATMIKTLKELGFSNHLCIT